MRAKQTVLHEDGVYAVCTLTQGDARYLAGASEQRGGGCSLISLNQSDLRESVWTNRGGTMRVCDDGVGGLFAVQNFFMGTTADDTQIVHCEKRDGVWRSKIVVKMPCLHNLTVVKRGEKRYLIFATLCESRTDGADWSKPGSVYAAEITGQTLIPKTILSGLSKNHGFMQTKLRGNDCILVSGGEGAFAIYPAEKDDAWDVEKLFDFEISDLCACDLDGDGLDEIGLYQGFHGDRFVVYHESDHGYEEVCSVPVTFGHPIYGGHGVMLAGSRKGDGELVEISFEGGAYRVKPVAEGLHASSVCAISVNGEDGVAVACKNGDIVSFLF